MPVRNIFVIALTTIISLTCYSTASRSRYANLFAEVLQTIEQQALQEYSRPELFQFAMEGLTSQLDEHSRYISGEPFQLLTEDLDQKFGGVGMYLETNPKTNQLTVLAPIVGAPAFQAGIQAGDLVLEIAGHFSDSMSREDAVRLIRGPPGTEVDILISRKGVNKLHRLTRASIHEPSVHGDYRNPDGSWNFHLRDYPGIGYIHLLQFATNTTDETKAALESIGSTVDSLILDLRNNTGGLLDGAIDMCDLFLPPGKPVVSTFGRKNVLLQEHFTRSQPKFPLEKPLVILVNRDSASASEIVAACLQDHDRAIVIGEKTWGKGTVQLLIPIENGRSGLKLTTASYRPPSGKPIDRYDPEAVKSEVWGVQPNLGFAIEVSPESNFNHRRLRNFLDLRGLMAPDILAEREAEYAEIVDEPLERAIDYLLKLQVDRIAA